jgi:hypothetical protein
MKIFSNKEEKEWKTQIKPIEIFFINNYFLGITDFQEIIIFEPRTNKIINKIKIDENEKNVNEKEENKKITFQVYNKDNKTGIKTEKGEIYYLQMTEIISLLKSILKEEKQKGNEREEKYKNIMRISKISEDFNIFGWNIEFLLELILLDYKENKIEKLEKEYIINKLVKNLENPSLVLSITKNLYEQNLMIQNINEIFNLLNFENVNNHGNDLNKEIYNKLTPLNLKLQVVLDNYLSKKVDIEIIKFKKKFDKFEKFNDFLLLTDIELILQNDDDFILSFLLKYFNLGNIII